MPHRDTQTLCHPMCRRVTHYLSCHGAANRRVQEQQMWAARQSQLNLEGRGDQRLPKRSSSQGEGNSKRVTRDGVPPMKRRRFAEQRSYFSGSPYSDDGDRAADGSRDQGADTQGCSGSFSGGKPEMGRPLSTSARDGADAELEALLSKCRVRGRGAVGSRADEPGPFLPVPDTGVAQPEHDTCALSA